MKTSVRIVFMIWGSALIHHDVECAGNCGNSSDGGIKIDKNINGNCTSTIQTDGSPMKIEVDSRRIGQNILEIVDTESGLTLLLFSDISVKLKLTAATTRLQVHFCFKEAITDHVTVITRRKTRYIPTDSKEKRFLDGLLSDPQIQLVVIVVLGVCVCVLIVSLVCCCAQCQTLTNRRFSPNDSVDTCTTREQNERSPVPNIEMATISGKTDNGQTERVYEEITDENVMGMKPMSTNEMCVGECPQHEEGGGNKTTVGAQNHDYVNCQGGAGLLYKIRSLKLSSLRFKRQGLKFMNQKFDQ